MPVLDTTEVREAVDRGVALLDEREPNWRDQVDPRYLDMRTACNCILGQVYGRGPFADPGWSLGLHELGLAFNSDDLTLQYAAEYGFTVPQQRIAQAAALGLVDVAWNELRAEWLRRLP